MTAHNSISLAIDLATIQREQALAQLQQARQADAYAQAQMLQLKDYLQETEQRWITSARTNVSPELLHHQFQFTSRLSQAILLQSSALENTKTRIEAAQQALLQVEIRLASFRKLLAKRQALQTVQQQRREQRQTDEFASQQILRNQRIQVESAL